VVEGCSSVGRDGKGDGVIPAFDILAGGTSAWVRVPLVFVMDQGEDLLAVGCIDGVEPLAVVEAGGVGIFVGGHGHTAIEREMVEVGSGHTPISVVRGDELHTPLVISKGTGGGVRDVGRPASVLAPVENDLFWSRDLDPRGFPHVADDYQPGQDGGERQQSPP
jgi:hypothetical protein